VLLFVCLFLDRVLLYRPGWPQALYLAQHGLEVVKLCFSLQSTEITDMCHHTRLVFLEMENWLEADLLANNNFSV
jgi:hypothetical protein